MCVLKPSIARYFGFSVIEIAIVKVILLATRLSKKLTHRLMRRKPRNRALTPGPHSQEMIGQVNARRDCRG